MQWGLKVINWWKVLNAIIYKLECWTDRSNNLANTRLLTFSWNQPRGWNAAAAVYNQLSGRSLLSSCCSQNLRSNNIQGYISSGYPKNEVRKEVRTSVRFSGKILPFLTKKLEVFWELFFSIVNSTNFPLFFRNFPNFQYKKNGPKKKKRTH